MIGISWEEGVYKTVYCGFEDVIIIFNIYIVRGYVAKILLTASLFFCN